MLMPNLDGMSSDELLTFAERARKARRGSSMRTASEYAVCKAAAIQLRNAGKVVQAVRLEERCDVIYQRLPQSARW